jgi:oxygen-dependent protoporphyrinogen oxidase
VVSIERPRSISDAEAGYPATGGATRQPSAYLVRLASGDIIEAGAVVIAVPAFVAADLLVSVDADVARLCRDVPYASTCTVALAYPRAAVRHPLNGSGFIVPRLERGTRIMAASWMSSKWPGRAPDGHVLLRAFVGGTRNPELFELDDAAVTSLAHADLARLLGIDRPPALVRVYRWRRANAQHIVGHLARMATIDARLGRARGLFVTGSGFRGTGIPDCVADGRAVARQAAAYVAPAT